MTHPWKKTVVLFLIGQLISLFGSSLVQYALMWTVTLESQSGTMMTISILCGFLPMLFLAPFAGVWADRFPRKRLIVLADGGIALATLVLAAVMALGHRDLWLIFLFMAIRALGSAVHGPAISAVLPQIVPQEELTRVSGINGSLQAAVTLVSPMVSGALLSLVNMQVILLIDVLTAATAIFLLLAFIPIPTHAKALSEQTSGYLADLRDGLSYVAGHPYVRQFFLFTAAFLVLAAPAAFLTPLQVTRTFGADYWRLTAVEVLFSLGMMAGGGLIAAWGGFRNRLHTMMAATLLFGLCTLAFGLVPNFWIYLGFMLLCGFSMPLFNTPATVVMQQRVDGDYLGRVFGVMSMIASIGMPVGMLVFGPLADRVPIETLLLVTGPAIVVVGLLALRSRTMLAAGEPLPKPEVADTAPAGE